MKCDVKRLSDSPAAGEKPVKVITVLGVLGVGQKAEYRLGKGLKERYRLPGTEFTNTLPLLCTLFGEKNIVPLYTKTAGEIQRKVLASEGFDSALLDNDDGLIADEQDYPKVFEMINELLRVEENVIVDISHGFRHLPVLMIVALVMQNIRDTGKIRHILFTKEIEPRKQYELIDLKAYLDIANVSFALASFKDNYTVAHHIRCGDEKYQELIDLLAQFSEHILANSIIELIESEDALVARILQRLETLEAEPYLGLGAYLRPLRLHLHHVMTLKKLPKYERLYRMAEFLAEKGYFLNAVTLLDEAVGHYCAWCFRSYDPSVAERIDRFMADPSEKAAAYKLANHSKNIVKNSDSFSGPYLAAPQANRLRSAESKRLQRKKSRIRKRIPQEIMARLQELGLEIKFTRQAEAQADPVKKLIVTTIGSLDNVDELRRFIRDIDTLRNNLAHANSSSPLKEVRERTADLLERYRSIVKRKILQID